MDVVICWLLGCLHQIGYTAKLTLGPTVALKIPGALWYIYIVI